ncbi:MAG: single-stranded-DNA-specific exonuclease RecJ [Planctomycetota bacterium]
MRGMTRRWKLQEAAADGPTTGTEPDASRGRHADRVLIERILRSRGIHDSTAIESFCDPRLSNLHPPNHIPNNARAAERLVDAVRSGRTVAIYGDYDVDGITATSILFHIIRTAEPKADVRTYVPHRLEEGYGLNAEALRQLRRDGADVVVSVDSGVTAVEPAAVAKEIGLELIITDHHEMPTDGILPDALIVHPRLPGSAYPNGDLCGAGVAFKLAWQFAIEWCQSERVSDVFKQALMQLLPLAALGTIADIVPLTGENRILTAFGLRLIRSTELTGLKALIKASELESDSIDAEKVGFVLGPRLNAIGRMGHAADAVRLFTEANDADAMSIAQQLAQYNKERQKTERRIVDQACKRAEEAGMTLDDRRGIVLAHPDWHPGVVGIVASRLVDRFGRPAIIMRDLDGQCQGSGRSVDGFNLHQALMRCESHLDTFGGHHAAAGLRLQSSALPAFTEAFIAQANAAIEINELVPVLHIDCSASLTEFSLPAVEGLQKLSPFGKSNRKPTFLLTDLAVDEAPRQMGSNGRHLMVRLRQDGPNGRRLVRAVWWNAGSRVSEIAPGMRLDAAIEPKLNHWQGRTSVEAEIRDVRVRSES